MEFIHKFVSRPHQQNGVIRLTHR